MTTETQYNKYLNKAYSQLPEQVSSEDRFEVPQPKSEAVGNRTFIYNFKEVCDRIRRDQDQVLKYLSKELGTSGVFDGDYAVFKGRFSKDSIKRLIDGFVSREVICPVCNKPDTKIVREGRIDFLVCEACGAKSSIRK